MDIGVLITGIIGLCSTVVSGWVSWFFTRKKYYSEVDKNLIENMEKSLEFYKKLSDDNRQRLAEMAERNAKLEDELRELRMQVLTLTTNICMDLTCRKRINKTKGSTSTKTQTKKTENLAVINPDKEEK